MMSGANWSLDQSLVSNVTCGAGSLCHEETPDFWVDYIFSPDFSDG